MWGKQTQYKANQTQYKANQTQSFTRAFYAVLEQLKQVKS